MIATLNTIANKKNTCEDFFFTKENENFIWGAIFDGCSTGINSVWAAHTLNYLFSDISIEYYLTNESILNVINKSNLILNTLNLTVNNLLSTCVLFKYDKINKIFKIRSFGDCYYYLNDLEFNIDQQNTPDYLGYYVMSNDEVEIIEYFNKYPIETYFNISKFIVCSDGIEKINISQFHKPKHPEVYELLFQHPTSPTFLQRMWNILKKEGYEVNDDLTIISYATN